MGHCRPRHILGAGAISRTFRDIEENFLWSRVTTLATKGTTTTQAVDSCHCTPFVVSTTIDNTSRIHHTCFIDSNIMVSLCVYALLHCCHGGRDGWHAKHREQELRGRMDMLFMDMEHLYSTYFVKAKDRPSNRRRVAAQHALEGGPVGIYKLYFVDNLLRQERILYELNMAYLLDEYADTFVDLMIILDYGKEDREQKRSQLKPTGCRRPSQAARSNMERVRSRSSSPTASCREIM